MKGEREFYLSKLILIEELAMQHTTQGTSFDLTNSSTSTTAQPVAFAQQLLDALYAPPSQAYSID